jgi:diguanylate cyclase (GGDEF)-like protein
MEYCKVVESGGPLEKESFSYAGLYGDYSLERAFDIHATKLGDGIAATWRDVTERKRAEDELRHLSTHDILTGLYNRTYFETEVSRLKQGRQYPVSVIMIDVDGLKQMNDSQGHAAGDELLRRTAALLKLSFRAEDVVARIGGDEFTVLLPQTDDQALQAILNRIRVNLVTNQIIEDSPMLSFSIGAAIAKNGEILEEVINQADKRMYRDKFEHTRPAKVRGRHKKES